MCVDWEVGDMGKGQKEEVYKADLSDRGADKLT